MVRAHWNGAMIAESDDTVIVEGNHYFPPEAVNREYLVPSTTTTRCPWKGQASYYSLEVDGKVNHDAAWYYSAPLPAASNITGRIAFWRGVKIDDAGSTDRHRSLFDRVRRRDKTGVVGEAPAAPPVATPAQPHLDDVAVADVGDADFPAILHGRVTIADFWAPWCGPCKQLHPMFDAQAGEHAGGPVRFVRVNVDANPGIATALGVMSIPTVMVFGPDGAELDRQIGLPSKARLDELVRNATALAANAAGRGAP